MHVLLEVDETTCVIRRATARVRGRGVAFAAASALCEAAEGRTVLAAAALGLKTIHPDFAVMDDEDRERALVVEDGFHHALGRWVVARARARSLGAAPTAVVDQQLHALVAMSGGVDSAIALHTARGTIDLGNNGGAAARVPAELRPVAGVTLRLWIDPKAPDPDAACCAPDSVRRARHTCHDAGVPHLGIDLRTQFAAKVVGPFVAAYASGETPNPCVRCNGEFRLDELVAIADAVGAPTVVTGHYVRTVERDGVSLAQRAVDPSKCQAYMLASLAPATLARLRFPLGGQLKLRTREQAAGLGLVQATVRDSQDVCFLGGGDYRPFLARAGGLGITGTLQTREGRVVGVHDGIARFTPGQRKGLSVGGESPFGGGAWYVLDVDPESGVVTIGGRTELATHVVLVDDVAWHAPGAVPERAFAQLRYRTREGAAACRVIEPDADGEPWQLIFDAPVSGVAPGQVACVFDADGVVLGAGRILRGARPLVQEGPLARTSKLEPLGTTV